MAQLSLELLSTWAVVMPALPVESSGTVMF